jgi:hypothetical protein
MRVVSPATWGFDSHSPHFYANPVKIQKKIMKNYNIFDIENFKKVFANTKARYLGIRRLFENSYHIII